MKRHRPSIRAAGIGLLLAAASIGIGAAHAGTLTIIGNQVLGASGVSVNGATYSVAFVDGTCADLFTDCNSSSDFDFTTLADADAASTALVSLLEAYPYPDRVTGCTSSEECAIWTPYAPNGSSVLASLAIVFNDAFFGTGAIQGNGSTPVINNFGDNTSFGSGNVWAQWTPTPVPLPAAAWLFLSAVGGLAVMGRRQKSRIQRVRA